MSYARFLPAFALAVSVVGAAIAVPPPAAAVMAGHRDPADLIRDLASPSYPTRERASDELWKLGRDAVPALRLAAGSGDPEVARRAQDILGRFESGIFPDTPPEAIPFIADFHSGQLDKQMQAVTGLIRLGGTTIPTLQALLSRELPTKSRGPLFEHLCWVLRAEVPRAMFAGRFQMAEHLLALNALGPCDQGLNDYALFLAWQGRAAAGAAELDSVREGGGRAVAAANRALVFVYRAAGQRQKATEAARELARTDPTASSLLDGLLEEAGEWSELADRSARGLGTANSRDGLTIFRLRRAGREDEADELTERQKDADMGDRVRYGGIDEATLALMLGGRPLDGIERMRAIGQLLHILTDVLSARAQFADAVGIVKQDSEVAPTLDRLFGNSRARLLSQLGERTRAAEVFEAIAAKLRQQPRDDTGLFQLLRAEARSGRHDLACEHLANALTAPERAERDFDDGTTIGWLVAGRTDPFEALFEGDAEVAKFWWWALREADRKAVPGDTMRLVRALLTGSAAPDDLSRAVRVAGRLHLDAEDGAIRALALAAAYRVAGRPNAAADSLADAAEKLTARPADDTDSYQARRFGRGSRSWVFGTDERFRFWLELGDLLADAGRNREAAERYLQGWQRHPENPLLLYLSGRSLVDAGDEPEGTRRAELAHRVALGNARIRGRFLEELVARGHAAAVRTERDLVRDAGWVNETYLGNVWNQTARAANFLRDFPAAAEANRRAIHYLLRMPRVTYVEGYAYVTVPQMGKVAESRGLLAAGQTDEALRQAREVLAVLPGNLEVPNGLVPDLDKLGRTADADGLFRQVWDVYEQVIADYPASGWARYSAAWLAANCRRELDQGIRHARRAVELDPEAKTFREALAEVHFRRGERADAVAVMAKLLAADPRNHTYRRQLERYRTAAFDSPLPDVDAD